MDSAEFLEQLDGDKFTEMETNESIFDSKDKCVFKGRTRGKYVKYVISAESWEEVLAALPNQVKIKVF